MQGTEESKSSICSLFNSILELVPETVSIQAALEAQKQHGMAPSLTPNHSPVLDNDDHFDSFRSSSSNIGIGNQNQQQQNQPSHSGQTSSNSSSIKSSKSAVDFFAKKASGNVNFLLNANSTSIGGDNTEEIIDISDDIVNS